MTFLKKHQQILTKSFFVLFVCSVVILPALTPIVASADPKAESLVKNAKVGTEVEDPGTKFGCFDGSNTPTSFAGCTAAAAYYMLFVPAYTVAGWVSILFNVSFYKLVVGMGATLQKDKMPGIYVAWEALRDIGNVFLVFLLVYIGIATILGIPKYNYKNILWRVLLAALLVNFSMTFAKVVIDVSNITAIQIFARLSDTATPNSGLSAINSDSISACIQSAGTKSFKDTAKDNSMDSCYNEGLAEAFWTKLGVTSLFNIDKAGTRSLDMEKVGGKNAQWAMALSATMAAIMFAVLAFVFGATAFFLIARFVLLVFLIIVSPVAFVAWITGVGGFGRDWWHKLINQSIFAPLILLTWWLALTVLDGVSQGDLAKTSGVNPESLSIVLSFIIVIGFLITGLFLAKYLGARGATAAISTGRRWSRRAAGAIVTGGAVVGGIATRQSLGRLSNAAARRYTNAVANAQDPNNPNADTLASRSMRRIAGTRVDRGIHATLAAPNQARFFGRRSRAERVTTRDTQNQARQRDLDTAQRTQTLQNAMTPQPGATPAQQQAHRQAIRGASVGELNNNADTVRQNPQSLGHVSHGTWRQFRENRNNTFSDAEIRNFETVRNQQFMNMNATEVANEVRTSNPRDLAGHQATFLGRPETVSNMTVGGLTGMIRAGLSQDKRDAIRATVEAQANIMTDPAQVSTLTQAEQDNVLNLYNWFNDPNRNQV